MGFVGNIWTTLSIYIPDEWEDSRRPQSLMQFHSSYSHYQSPFQLVLGSKRGLVWKHMSGGGFNVFEQGNQNLFALVHLLLLLLFHDLELSLSFFDLA